MDTANPRISPLRANLFFISLDWGLFEEGGLYEGGYKIIVDIKKTLLKDLVYFSILPNYQTRKLPKE